MSADFPAAEAFERAVQSHQAGYVAEAENICQQIVAAHPNNADAWHLLGVIALQTANHAAAVDRLKAAALLDPQNCETQNNLGIALKNHHDIDEAIHCFGQAIELHPDFVEAHYNLANALQERGRLDEAIAAYRQAIHRRPELPEALSSLGILLVTQGKVEEGLDCFQKASQLLPRHPEIYVHMGAALVMLGKLSEAVASFQQALVLEPTNAETYKQLGHTLGKLGILADAANCFRRAIELDLGDVHSLDTLGNILKDVGQVDAAINIFRQAISLCPDSIRPHTNLLFTIQFSPAYDAAAIREEHSRWDQRHAAELEKSCPPHSNDRNPSRRLRVGYVSPNFRNHCQSLFMLPLLRCHDHAQLEIVCYSDDSSPDDITQQMRSSADSWRETFGLTDKQLVQQIRDDQIDILVDLTMHMAHSRPLMFARKPSPIQVCWLAYPGTTGLTAMDYRLTDPYLDPPDVSDAFYSETSFRLPQTFWCYDPLTDVPGVNALPARKNGFITFGSLNNFCKTNGSVFKLWSQVLKVVEHSRLILLVPEPACRQQIFTAFEECGITSDRITTELVRLRPQYLELYHQIDIALDTFPYNGHTTSLDSFWMGVPVITMVGKTVVGRAGVSQLMNLRLPELIAKTPDEFVNTASVLARDLDRLSQLRSSLRERMLRSPLMDAPHFAKNVEAAYRTMWQRWCTA